MDQLSEVLNQKLKAMKGGRDMENGENHPPQKPSPTVILEDKTLGRLAGGFTQVPNFLLRRKDLSPGAKITYSLLLSYAWQENFCFPAQEQLAKDSGYSVRQVQRTLIELRGKDLITWKQVGLNRPNIYRLLPIFSKDTKTDKKSKENSGHDKMSLPDTTYMSGPDTTPMSYYKDSYKNTHNVDVDETQLNENDSLPNDTEIEREGLLNLIVEELGDRNPKSKPTYRRIINTLGSQIVWRLLGNVKEADRDGLIKTTRAKYFMGMAKAVAQEQGLKLGFRSTTPQPHVH